MTVRELRKILTEYEDDAEVRIVDQYDGETYYHNEIANVEFECDDGEFVVLSSDVDET